MTFEIKCFVIWVSSPPTTSCIAFLCLLRLLMSKTNMPAPQGCAEVNWKLHRKDLDNHSMSRKILMPSLAPGLSSESPWVGHCSMSQSTLAVYWKLINSAQRWGIWLELRTFVQKQSTGLCSPCQGEGGPMWLSIGTSRRLAAHSSTNLSWEKVAMHFVLKFLN